VSRGSYEKAVEKVCKKYNLERSELSMETALSRTKVGRELKVTGKTFAAGTPMSSTQKRQSGLTVKDRIGADWKLLPTCMTEYIKDWSKQGWQKS
jgi:hypothetical protein